jgi:hypothetical protein
MIAVSMDSRIAAAVTSLSSGPNAENWAILMHYIALNLVRARDELENHPTPQLSGYAQGMRAIFELLPRAEAAMNGERFIRRREIVGEEGFIMEPLEQTGVVFPEQE